jgi:hypothetical protein
MALYQKYFPTLYIIQLGNFQFSPSVGRIKFMMCSWSLIITMLPLHLYVATFKQQMHMEYVSLSWCDIQELAISIMVSCIEDCC